CTVAPCPSKMPRIGTSVVPATTVGSAAKLSRWPSRYTVGAGSSAAAPAPEAPVAKLPAMSATGPIFFHIIDSSLPSFAVTEASLHEAEVILREQAALCLLRNLLLISTIRRQPL